MYRRCLITAAIPEQKEIPMTLFMIVWKIIFREKYVEKNIRRQIIKIRHASDVLPNQPRKVRESAAAEETVSFYSIFHLCYYRDVSLLKLKTAFTWRHNQSLQQQQRWQWRELYIFSISIELKLPFVLNLPSFTCRAFSQLANNTNDFLSQRFSLFSLFFYLNTIENCIE